MENVLAVQNLEKYYGNRGNITKAIDGISFAVEQGEFVGIMGASGSGKTTLLNCIATIDNATSGQILIGGRDVTQLRARELSKFRREQLGFIFQDCNLLDTLTAYENIALALTIMRVPAKDILARVEKVSQQLEIASIVKKFPYQLSGGEKQRVAAARAIITRPQLILADEPTGNLDRANSREIIDLLKRLHDELHQTLIIITHDEGIALQADRILKIEDGHIVRDEVIRR